MLRRSFTRRTEKPEAADDESRIRSVALALQSYREHGAKELATKLGRKGYDSLTTAQVIEDLRESGLVSDHRFAEAFVRGHAARGHGPIRIRHELRELGVASELIDSSLKNEEFAWGELAAKVRGRKFGPAIPPTYAVRAKQMRFLQYRGFSTDQIRAAFAPHSHEADELPELDPDE
jgi:regulatory protein